MASVQEMRNALVSAITSEIPELFSYPSIDAVVQVPCIIVSVLKADYAVSVQRGFQTAVMSMGLDGLQEWTFELYVLVNVQDMQTSYSELDQYVGGTGDKSIRQAIFNNDTLGGVVEDCMVLTMDQYGGQYALTKIPHTGARLTIKVLTSGA